MTLGPPKRLGNPNHLSRRTLVKGLFAGSVFSYLESKTSAATLIGVLSDTANSKALLVPTMTGPVRCDSLGTTLMHEHLLWFGGPRLEDSGYTPIPEDKREESVDFAVVLLNGAEGVGIDTLVDLTPHRPIDLYQQIAKRTRVKIVPSAGF